MVITRGNTNDTVPQRNVIESISPGSPANLDGNSSQGDQIMSVKGTDVQNEGLLTVVDLLHCSNSPVNNMVAKSNKQFYTTNSPKKEIVEVPYYKTKTWMVSDEGSKDSDLILGNFQNSPSVGNTPIPKPRKKWLEKERSSKSLNFDVPDLTLNHSMKTCIEKWDKEIDKNALNEQLSRESCNIPDIIPSQVKHLVMTESFNTPNETDDRTEQNNNSVDNSSGNDILPGEIFHVVLDKKGGSLGLNIYQGSNSFSSHHIYIHSVIANGAADLDGRIKPGDKLLEVNGVVLENLSYQEVITKLRESPQIAHLVLERGSAETENELVNECKADFYSKDSQVLNQDSKVPVNDSLYSGHSHYTGNTPQNSLKENSNISFIVSLHDDNSNDNSEDKHCTSLPTSADLDSGAKGISSLSPHQHQHQRNDSVKSDEVSPESLPSSPSYAKVQNQNSLLTSYKSTPNLTENSDEEDNRNSSILYRNRSTDCLPNSPHFMNPHRALFDLYQNYAYTRGSSSNIHQIPAVPIRKKKLKKLEDILNYCNSDNTSYVYITKSSRGLGLSISGGRDTSKRDFFSQLIQIRKLYPLQPALECGQLALGDVILEVNGTSTIGLTNTEALELLRCTPQLVVLKIFRPSKSLIPSFSVLQGGIGSIFDSSSSSACSSLSRTETNTYNVETGEFEVTLIKKAGSLGFTIQRKESSNENGPEGIYVKALVREPAVSDGRIQPGDRILKVNGTVVSDMSHAEAITFIRNASDTVVLKLYRDEPPLTPDNLEDNCSASKHLRWEAMELLNDRVKHKDSSDESGTTKRKIKRKLERISHAHSSSSTDSESSSCTSSSGQEHVISESIEEDCSTVEDIPLDAIGLQRNQRPKSLDVLNSSDRKRISNFADEDSFHRQSSVMCPNADSNENHEINCNSTKGGDKNLLKWRGSTLPDSQECSSTNLDNENSVLSTVDSYINERRLSTLASDSDDDTYRPVPFPRTTSYSKDSMSVFHVDLNRGWHGRLGFSIQDPPPKSKFQAAMVKTVFPNSIADKDGRIKVGDQLLEVNNESMIHKPAREVIDILRKTRGVIKMVFCRSQTEP